MYKTYTHTHTHTNTNTHTHTHINRHKYINSYHLSKSIYRVRAVKKEQNKEGSEEKSFPTVHLKQAPLCVQSSVDMTSLSWEGVLRARLRARQHPTVSC